ncbi:MAG: hypothetical protein FJX75_09970 [Armatimonadetes bacterium]|nr:hypothetical protein [Armatimonadota bacterium]
MLWLAILMPAAPQAAEYREVTIPLREDHAGVAFAARRLSEECGAPVRFGATEAEAKPAVQGVLDGKAELRSDEGFEWTGDDAGIVLRAKSEEGLMYGLLELADRLHNGEAIEAQGVSDPAFTVRGDYLDLPFYLGCDLYDGRWRWHQDIEGKADSWFHDREHWRRMFEIYARRRLNHIMLQHPHPFPAFITYPQNPEAAYFDEATVARNADTLRWLIDEGAKYGVHFSILTWNEWVPRGFAEAHKIPQEGPQTPESAALNRTSYQELFRRFPKLYGLVTMAAESPPGCVEFVRDNVVKPLAELPNPPRITYWTWCSYPEDVNTVLDGYPGETAIMHYLQYEQLFKPMVDPRVGMMSRACGNRPVIVMGGPGTATGQLYWGDPYVIRDILRSAPAQNVSGVFFCGLDSWQWVSDKWIGWEGLARYWWDPSRDDGELGDTIPIRNGANAGELGDTIPIRNGANWVMSPNSYWERRIAEVLGDRAFGKPLLSAYTHASAVPMRMLCLTHSQSDVFRPQYGMALVFYLGMPTLSTYVFENHEKIDERGRLWPRMGLTWPNPDWGEKVVGVVDFVEGGTGGLARDTTADAGATALTGEAARATTPLNIADELDAHAEAIGKAVEEMRPLRDKCKWGSERFDKLLGVLTMNEMLARHYAAKTRAAVAWQRWNVGESGDTIPVRDDANRVMSPDSLVLEQLDRSVAYWREYAEVEQALYGRDYPAKRNMLTKPPPWTHMDLWVNYQYEPDYSFVGYGDRLQRERDLIAAAMAEGRHELPYELDLLPPVQGEGIARIDANGPSGGFATQSFPPKATAELQGGKLLCDFKGGRGDFYFPFVTKPEQLRLERGVKYEVIFRYEITRVGEESPLKLSFGARTSEGTWHKDVGVRYFEGPVGTTGEIRTQFTPQEYDDYYVYLSMNGDGTVAVQDVRLVKGAR